MYSHVFVILLLFVINATTMYLDDASVCPNATVVMGIVPKLETNGKQKMDVRLYSPMEIGANTKTHVEVFVMRTNGWVKIWDLWHNDFCKFMARYGATASADLLRQANIRANHCPLPKMNVTMSDYVFDWHKIGYKILPKGRFKAEVDIYRTIDNVIIGCFAMCFTNK